VRQIQGEFPFVIIHLNTIFSKETYSELIAAVIVVWDASSSSITSYVVGNQDVICLMSKYVSCEYTALISLQCPKLMNGQTGSSSY